jgi:hypothetical protein
VVSLNVVPFVGPNYCDIPAQLRQLADDIEAGKIRDIVSTVMVIDCADALYVEHWGENVTLHQGIGILETGKHYLLNQILPPDFD